MKNPKVILVKNIITKEKKDFDFGSRFRMLQYKALSKFRFFLAVYCNAVYDGILCWSPTLAGTTTNQSCPYAKKFNSSRKY